MVRVLSRRWGDDVHQQKEKKISYASERMNPGKMAGMESYFYKVRGAVYKPEARSNNRAFEWQYF
jgi:hypothetical protein